VAVGVAGEGFNFIDRTREKMRRKGWAVAADATGGDDQEIVEALVVDDGRRAMSKRWSRRPGRSLEGTSRMRERSRADSRQNQGFGVEVGDGGDAEVGFGLVRSCEMIFGMRRGC